MADLARSVVLVLPRDAIDAFPDPGGPGADDRESVVLKSGPAKGRPWRRKPRLQVRMAPGLDARTIRRALGIALAQDRGDVDVRLEKSFDPAYASRDRRKGDKELGLLIRESRDDLERLKAMVSALSFEPLAGGVKTRDDALHVLGLPPGSLPDQDTLRARFRMLATIHHPRRTPWQPQAHEPAQRRQGAARPRRRLEHSPFSCTQSIGCPPTLPLPRKGEGQGGDRLIS